MTERPHIPIDVQREIFAEAGHRCAVCGTTFPLERAHIIPWSKSADHSASNLICLCANCHERADHDWDAKTLRGYKVKPWVGRHGVNTDVAEMTSLEIEIDMDLEHFNDTKRKWLQHALASFLDIHPDAVRVRSIREGSVRVTVSLPRDTASRLLDAFSHSDPRMHQHLAPLHITSIKPRAPKVFVSYGRNESQARDVATLLHALGIAPVLLRQTASFGRTSVERIESVVEDADFAIIVATGDDLGRSSYELDSRLSSRARHNVIFELGYLTAKLGRERLFLLHDRSIELPFDMRGVVAMAIDDTGAWALELTGWLRSAGLAVNR